MRKIIFIILVNLSLSYFSFGQIETEHKFMLELENKTFSTEDTIHISFKLDSLEVLYSNFGGCGGGFVYVIICHTDSGLSHFQVDCCLDLMEYEYFNEGEIQIVIYDPGMYSVQFFVREKWQNIVPENRYEQTLTTPKFEIIKNVD